VVAADTPGLRLGETVERYLEGAPLDLVAEVLAEIHGDPVRLMDGEPLREQLDGCRECRRWSECTQDAAQRRCLVRASAPTASMPNAITAKLAGSGTGAASSRNAPVPPRPPLALTTSIVRE